MPRQSLGALLGNVDDKPAPDASTATPQAAPPARERAITESEPAPQPDSAPGPSTSSPSRPSRSKAQETQGPAYLHLVRKDTRLREDQLNDLTVHARRLNRAKAAGTPRITDNTLIRVAVDLLLGRVTSARGADEQALLESLKS